MSYTKTDWNDNTSPAINATNLDKIEQGIADAHTTADAAIAKAILDAAGDLLTASAADTPARLAKGSDDEVLSVTSGSLDYRKVVNAMVDAAAAIDYSKLDLEGSIDNADIAAAAAIAYSKLNLAASIVNTDIGAAAAIAYSKLNLAGAIVNADISNSAAIAYSKLALTNEIVNADIDDAAAIAYSKLDLDGSLAAADAGFVFSSYTPAWTSTGTQPALVDGTAVGSYVQLGDLVMGSLQITLGSSSTNGTGTYRFSIPVEAAVTTTRFPLGHGTVRDTGTAVWSCVATPGTSTTLELVVANSVTTPGLATATAPMTPASGDTYLVSFMYEAA